MSFILFHEWSAVLLEAITEESRAIEVGGRRPGGQGVGVTGPFPEGRGGIEPYIALLIIVTPDVRAWIFRKYSRNDTDVYRNPP